MRSFAESPRSVAPPSNGRIDSIESWKRPVQDGLSCITDLRGVPVTFDGTKALDIGSPDGRFISVLRALGARDVWAIDPSEKELSSRRLRRQFFGSDTTKP